MQYPFVFQIDGILWLKTKQRRGQAALFCGQSAM
jgi:hypothetical protein